MGTKKMVTKIRTGENFTIVRSIDGLAICVVAVPDENKTLITVSHGDRTRTVMLGFSKKNTFTMAMNIAMKLTTKGTEQECV